MMNGTLCSELININLVELGYLNPCKGQEVVNKVTHITRSVSSDLMMYHICTLLFMIG